MIWSRNPLEIIAETLASASDDVFEASEDIIAALEDAGWRFAWIGELAESRWRDG